MFRHGVSIPFVISREFAKKGVVCQEKRYIINITLRERRLVIFYVSKVALDRLSSTVLAFFIIPISKSLCVRAEIVEEGAAMAGF